MIKRYENLHTPYIVICYAQVRSRGNLLDSSLAVIPSIREAMSDLDYRMNRHEAFLADAELRYRQDRSRLLVKLNRLLSVFADLRRRQEERFPIVPAVERYREQEDLDDHDDATGDDPSRVPGGEEDIEADDDVTGEETAGETEAATATVGATTPDVDDDDGDDTAEDTGSTGDTGDDNQVTEVTTPLPVSTDDYDYRYTYRYNYTIPATSTTTIEWSSAPAQFLRRYHLWANFRTLPDY